MNLPPKIKKHINPLSIVSFILVGASLMLIMQPGPEGWGYLGGALLFMMFALPGFTAHTIILWATKSRKKRLLLQSICAILLITFFIWIRLAGERLDGLF